jgi:hypothetical protein
VLKEWLNCLESVKKKKEIKKKIQAEN